MHVNKITSKIVGFASNLSFLLIRACNFFFGFIGMFFLMGLCYVVVVVLLLKWFLKEKRLVLISKRTCSHWKGKLVSPRFFCVKIFSYFCCFGLSYVLDSVFLASCIQVLMMFLSLWILLLFQHWFLFLFLLFVLLIFFCSENLVAFS